MHPKPCNKILKYLSIIKFFRGYKRFSNFPDGIKDLSFNSIYKEKGVNF